MRGGQNDEPIGIDEARFLGIDVGLPDDFHLMLPAVKKRKEHAAAAAEGLAQNAAKKVEQASAAGLWDILTSQKKRSQAGPEQSLQQDC